MTLSEELEQILKDAGAALVGYGDMRGLETSGYPFGAAVAVPVPVPIVEGITDGPTKEYYDMYYELNARLDHIVTCGEQFLKGRGYRALAQTTSVVKTDPQWRSPLPHKTVATRAGLGWIGKNCLLVTDRYGSAIRLSSLLTDAPLKTGAPVNDSRCGGCRICADACPAQALKGTLWKAGMEREQLLDRTACKKKQVELMLSRTGIEQDLCGKCFAVCPYTRSYLARSKKLSCKADEYEGTVL